MTDEHNPWERQPWDTSASFRAFRLYLEQDAPRSVDAACRTHKGYEGDTKKRATRVWRNWSQGKDPKGDPIPNAQPWAKRAEAWDDHLAAQDILKWEQRRAEQREREWQGGQSLFERAEQIAKLPYIRGKKIDYVLVTPEMVGQEIATTTTVEPLNVSAKDEATLRQTASKLGRLAAGMETEKQKHEHSGPEGGPIVMKEEPVDLSKLSDEELDELERILGKTEGGSGKEGTE